MLFNYKIPAKPISYMCKAGTQEAVERDYKSVKYIVIHYTGNTNDTAKNNLDYFHNGNTRSAGAHYFVDQQGKAGKSINLKYIAYHCGGGIQTNDKGSSTYYGKCVNANSVGIELCDMVGKLPSEKMTKKVKKLVKHIRKYCPNAKTIIRHWDVNGKICPASLIGTNNTHWKKFKKEIGG